MTSPQSPLQLNQAFSSSISCISCQYVTLTLNYLFMLKKYAGWIIYNVHYSLCKSLVMQLALSSYLQVCFSIANHVVMSISLMYEQPESGKSLISYAIQILILHLIPFRKDLMARKPRNVRNDRLTDWCFFRIYLVKV